VSDETSTPPTKPTLFALIGRLPTLLVGLAKDEMELAKWEVATKLKRAGVGVVFVAAAVVVAGFFFGALVAAAVLGLAVALPPWLAALIVAGALVVVAGIFALVGVTFLKNALPPLPTRSVESIKRDLKTIKGVEADGR